MQLKDMPRMVVQSHMPAEIQLMQKCTPQYVKRILEKTQAFPEIRSLAELPQDSLRLLKGGNASALYSLETKEHFAVIKLRRDGVEAEYEAIEAWRAHGVPVPSILKKGALADTKHLPAVKYLILDFIVDRRGEPAPTGTLYLEKNPGRARRVGQFMGRTLARMHRAKSNRTFGEYADMGGSNKAPLKSWNSYLMGYVDMHRTYLTRLGLSSRIIRELAKAVKDMQFPAEGTYVHGDYSLRNVMIESSNPLKMVVFDPNPLIGDPSWDIAVIFNNRDYRRKRYEREPGNAEYRKIFKREERFFEGFWKSYRIASKEKIDLERIWLSQLIQSILHLQTEERKEYADTAMKGLEMRVRREALFERFGSLRLTA